MYHHSVGEPFLLEVFYNLFKAKTFTFLDAGVNFGQTLLKIKSINPNAAYIGFEPSGLCSYYTSHLIKVNRIAHAKLIRCALSNTTGVLTLHAQSEGDTRATILEGAIDFGEDVFQELVPVVTLDSLIPIIIAAGKDIILKIDVEGAEWLVLQGAQEFIEGYRPVIVFENLPYMGDQVKQVQQQSISDFFNKRNYRLYFLDESRNAVEAIDAINNEKEFSNTNYLAVPDEQTKLFAMLT